MWSRPHKNKQGYRVPGQIGLVKMYQKAAGISDPEYRQLLEEITGHTTSTAPALTQYHFDMFMPALELRLHYRVANGLVPEPASRRMSNLWYWRRRCPATGNENSRQRWKIGAIWKQLQPYLPPERRTDAYLAGIAAHACGARIANAYELKAWQAHMLIEALKDRLHYAARAGAPPPEADGPGPRADIAIPAPAAPEDQPEEVPF